MRSALVPTANIGSSLGYIVMAGGLMFQSQKVVLVGALLFSAVLMFQIVTLPVEFDASARAKALAVERGLILPQEREGMNRVLNAAALTYVAARGLDPHDAPLFSDALGFARRSQPRLVS